MTADENFYPSLFKYEFDVHYRHFQRYLDAMKILGRCGKDELWLDCACGSGYGTRLLADFCSRIIGYDINKAAVTYAQSHYQQANCQFTSELHDLGDNRFDAVISIETIEHMSPEEAKLLLLRMGAWLKKEGSLVITTPIVPQSNPAPSNPFHLYEYDKTEFTGLLSESGFDIVKTYSQVVTFTDGETKEQAFFNCRKY